MRFYVALLLMFGLISCKSDQKEAQSSEDPTVDKTVEVTSQAADSLIYPEEKHFKSIRQITFGGDNAEAYWSFDDKQMIFQSNFSDWGVGCDQMFLMDIEQSFADSQPPMISTGKGRTTCAYFLPDNKHFVYGSTHLVDDECPDVPLRENGKYVCRL